MTEPPPLDERIALVQQTDVPITLDGQPAVVSGFGHKFAQVRLKSNGLGCEFAWATAAHIIANREGKFRT